MEIFLIICLIYCGVGCITNGKKFMENLEEK